MTAYSKPNYTVSQPLHSHARRTSEIAKTAFLAGTVFGLTLAVFAVVIFR